MKITAPQDAASSRYAHSAPSDSGSISFASSGASDRKITLTVTPAEGAVDCTVNATPLSFGAFSPLDGAAHDSEARITVACYSDTGSESAAYEIALDAGSAGTLTPRAMQSYGNQLAYNLYTSSTYGTVWGIAAGATVAGNLSLNAANVTYSHDYPVYGRILAGQSQAHIGTYNDSVTITVTY